MNLKVKTTAHPDGRLDVWFDGMPKPVIEDMSVFIKKQLLKEATKPKLKLVKRSA